MEEFSLLTNFQNYGAIGLICLIYTLMIYTLSKVFMGIIQKQSEKNFELYQQYSDSAKQMAESFILLKQTIELENEKLTNEIRMVKMEVKKQKRDTHNE